MRHEVTRVEALVLQLSYASGSAFADADGRIVFLPKVAGPWQCRAFSDDGPGTRFTFVDPSESGAVDFSARPPTRRRREIGAGAGLIALLFGGLTWWSTHRARVSPGGETRG